jgi:nucleoside-diphosphate-sugar epimerase
LVYGPSQDKNRILPQIISNCLINKKFPVTKGEQYCDFCFIDDVVNGVFKSFSSSKTNGEILNIGSGKPIRIKNIVNLVCKLIGKGKPQYGKLKYKKGINMELFPNIKKAKLKIGWFPKVTVAKGLSLTIKAYR